MCNGYNCHAFLMGGHIFATIMKSLWQYLLLAECTQDCKSEFNSYIYELNVILYLLILLNLILKHIF